MANTYRVTVEFSGSCDYDITLDDSINPTDAAEAIQNLIYNHGSLDNITNPVLECMNQEVVNVYKLEKV